MKNIIRKITALSLVAVLGVGLAACGATKESAEGTSTEATVANEDAVTEETANVETTNVRIGCSSLDGTTLASSMVSIAVNQGYLDEELSKVNAVAEYFPITGGGPATNEALAGKSIDFGVMGSFAATNGHDSGIETSVVGVDGSIGGAILTKKDNNINSIADLKGKKVGVTLGTSWEEILAIELQKNGLTTADIEVINLSLSDVYEALLLDQVDVMVGAIGMLGDDVVKAKDGEIVILADSRTDKDITISGYHLVTKSFEKEHPEVVQAYVNALYRATLYAKENPEVIRERYPDVTDDIYEWLYADYLDLIVDTLLDENVVSYGEKDTKFMYENGLILGEVDINDWFNSSYSESAKAEFN